MRVLFENVNGDPFRHVNGADTSGQNLFVREMTLGLGRRVDTVDVATRATSPDDPSFTRGEDGPGVWRIPAGPRRYLFRDEVENHLESYVNGLIAALSHAGITYDIVHGNYWLSATVAVALKKAGRACRLVYTPHSLGQWKAQQVGISPPNRYRIECEALACADAVHVLSEDEERCLRAMYPEAPGLVVRIGHGVDPAMFHYRSKDEARRALGWGQRDRVLLFVGRFEPQKNLPLALATFERLARESPGSESSSWKLVVCGGPTFAPPREDILPAPVRKAMAMTSLRGDVKLLGRVPHERLPFVYAAADALLMPSQYEPFGLVAAEALACGLPVAATATGGLRETVRDGVDGRLSAVGCEEAFYLAARGLLTDKQWQNPERRMTIASEAAKRLSWGKAADALQETYAQTLARKAVP